MKRGDRIIAREMKRYEKKRPDNCKTEMKKMKRYEKEETG